LQTVERAEANAKIAKVAAHAAGISAAQDAKVMHSIGKAVAKTAPHAIEAMGSGAVALGAKALGAYPVAIPAGANAVVEGKKTLVAGSIGALKVSAAVKRAEKVKAVSAAIAAKRIARIEAIYKKKELYAAKRLAKEGVEAFHAGVEAAGSLAAFLPKALIGAKVFGPEVIPFLLQGVLGGAARPDILTAIGRLAPDATSSLSGLLSLVAPPPAGQRINTRDSQSSAVSPAEELGGLLSLLPIPSDMEGFDFGEALSGLLPIVSGALQALMGGTARPGFDGMPFEFPQGLISNLANLVPDWLF
jgi:hypothetical protein